MLRHWFQIVSIYQCPLSEIHPEAFSVMRNLFSLKIESTTNFTPPLLDPIKKTLQRLELSRSPIFFINDTYFYGFEKLHKIYLRSIFLRTLPDFSKLSTILTSLDLTDNRIRNIHNMYDTNFTHLETIYLRGNLLEIIDSRRLNYPNLMTIDLAENRIMTVDVFGNFIFGKQLRMSSNEAGYEYPNTVMYLGHNIWHCDTSLLWVTTGYSMGQHMYMLRNGLIIVDYTFMKCNSPQRCNGSDVSAAGMCTSHGPLLLTWFNFNQSMEN